MDSGCFYIKDDLNLTEGVMKQFLVLWFKAIVS